MKNYKKGFIPLVVLLIVVAVAAVGGGMYYSHKKSEISEVRVQNNDAENNSVTNSSTTTSTESNQKNDSKSNIVQNIQPKPKPKPITQPIVLTPQITNINLTSGPIGTELEIFGLNFTSTSKIVFGNNNILTAIPIINNKKITGLVVEVPQFINYKCPAGGMGPCVGESTTPGQYPLVVTNGEVRSNTVQFTVTPGKVSAPTITNITPTSGSVGITATLVGTGFRHAGSEIDFKLNGITKSEVVGFNSDDGTTISFPIPATAVGCSYCQPGEALSPGIYGVTVKDAYGESNSVQFTIQ